MAFKALYNAWVEGECVIRARPRRGVASGRKLKERQERQAKRDSHQMARRLVQPDSERDSESHPMADESYDWWSHWSEWQKTDWQSREWKESQW